LIVALAHGAAHSGAAVPLSRAQQLFVVIVILVGPVAGLVFRRVRPRAGAAVITATMAGALIFGVVNHFLLPGTDNVLEVQGAWRAVFGSTAALLALLELGGTVAGLLTMRHSS
jgi:hypothetical protein